MIEIDLVKVFFRDGTTTAIFVSEDDDIRDAIVQMCENEGYDMLSVADYRIEATITPGYNRWDDETGSVVYVPPQRKPGSQALNGETKR